MNTNLRETLLAVMAEYGDAPGMFQTRPVLEEVARRAGIRHNGVQEQALLTLWGDMFRLGIVSPGYNLSNPEPPFCHLTERGRQTLKAASRDPANPDGYLAALRGIAKVPPVADAYIEEAVATYNSACYKAAAVMVGAAAETLILDLRDAVVARLNTLGRKVSQRLVDWRAKTVLDAVGSELTPHLAAMPTKLREAFQYTWPSFVQQIRAGRNDAGHPSSIAPITPDVVHASLLIFPELLKLAADLCSWVGASMP